MRISIVLLASCSFLVGVGVYAFWAAENSEAHSRAIRLGMRYQSRTEPGDILVFSALSIIIAVLLMILYALWDAPAPKPKTKYGDFHSPLKG